MQILRGSILEKVWKRSFMRWFCKYIKCPGCFLSVNLERFKIDIKHKHVWCQRCIDYSKRRKEKGVVRYHNGRYKWMNNGQKAYTAWYNLFRKSMNKKEIEKNIECFLDCLVRVRESTVWKWDQGSRVFFWRWGEHSKEA